MPTMLSIGYSEFSRLAWRAGSDFGAGAILSEIMLMADKFREHIYWGWLTRWCAIAHVLSCLSLDIWFTKRSIENYSESQAATDHNWDSIFRMDVNLVCLPTGLCWKKWCKSHLHVPYSYCNGYCCNVVRLADPLRFHTCHTLTFSVRLSRSLALKL